MPAFFVFLCFSDKRSNLEKHTSAVNQAGKETIRLPSVSLRENGQAKVSLSVCQQPKHDQAGVILPLPESENHALLLVDVCPTRCIHAVHEFLIDNT